MTALDVAKFEGLARDAQEHIAKARDAVLEMARIKTVSEHVLKATTDVVGCLQGARSLIIDCAEAVRDIGKRNERALAKMDTSLLKAEHDDAKDGW